MATKWLLEHFDLRACTEEEDVGTVTEATEDVGGLAW